MTPSQIKVDLLLQSIKYALKDVATAKDTLQNLIIERNTVFATIKPETKYRDVCVIEHKLEGLGIRINDTRIALRKTETYLKLEVKKHEKYLEECFFKA